MNAIITGTFTLLAALLGMFFTARQHNKSEETNLRKLAVELYLMIDTLARTQLISLRVACKYRIQDPKYNVESLLKAYPDLLSENMEAAETVLLTNFVDLEKHFIAFRNLMYRHKLYLYEIIAGSNPESHSKDYNSKDKNFETRTFNAARVLQSEIMDKYINPKIKKNIYYYRALILNKCKYFFTK